MIYHYTSIDTLEKILASKTIRFNSLNDVDDIRESELFLKNSLPQFIFVSCWTKDPKESIPLWDMYTKGNGVRIGLPDYPWRSIDSAEWDVPKGFNILHAPGQNYISPFEFKDIFGDRHIIMPPYSMSKEAFEKQVIYLPLEELRDKYNGIYKIVVKDGKYDISIRPLDFGLYKDSHWEFQNEFRFVLWIFPIGGEIDFSDYNSIEAITQDLFRHIELEMDSPLKDFYLPLDPNVLKDMQVTAGYRCSEEDLQRIEKILATNNLNIVITKSDLKIRKKIL